MDAYFACKPIKYNYRKSSQMHIKSYNNFFLNLHYNGDVTIQQLRAKQKDEKILMRNYITERIGHLLLVLMKVSNMISCFSERIISTMSSWISTRHLNIFFLMELYSLTVTML